MEERLMCITKWKKLMCKGYTLHDSNYMTPGKKQNYWNSRKTNGCLGLGGDGQREGCTEHREVLLLWNCFVWPYRGGCCCLVVQSCPIFVTSQIVAWQTPLFMGFLRQEHLGEFSLSSPGDLPIQGLNPCLLHGQMDSLPLTHQRSP